MTMQVHGRTESGAIEATIAGQRLAIPDSMANRHRQMVAQWEAEGNTIPAYVAPAVTVEQVKAEAHRRIVAICPEWRQRNLTDRRCELNDKGRVNWTVDELAEWNAIAAIWAQIKHIREVSDQIESIDPIPANYTSDHYWE